MGLTIMISRRCPDCGARIAHDEPAAGGTIRCDSCGHEFTAAGAPGDDLAERLRRKPRKRRTMLLTCGLVAGAVLLSCTGLSALIYFVFIRDIEEPLTAADRELPITAERLRAFVPTLHTDPTRGNLRKVRHLDGSRELTYEYESAGDGEESLYVNHEIGVERTEQDARYAYGGLGIGTNLGLRLEGDKLRQVERNELWRWGDDSKCVLLMNGDNKVGNLFMARKGRRYFSLMIVGVYFENPQAVRELLDRMLQRLDNYDG
jgi:predicted Zn finger-like uncharacterized protein